MIICAAVAAAAVASAADAQDASPAFGHPVAEADLAFWDSSIPPDGANLPPGEGGVETGREIFATRCAACHGETGAETDTRLTPLVGGAGTLATSSPRKTVGSFWPYATTLFDYVRRAMPYNAPKSLTDDEVYALTAYILNANGIVPDDAVMNAETLLAVEMPNRDGFVNAWAEQE
jgi:cytochrome c